MPSYNLLTFLDREMVDGCGTLADGKDSILDVLSHGSSCLDVEVLKHPMKSHVSNGLLSRGEAIKARLASFVSPSTDVPSFELFFVYVPEALALIVITDGLRHRNLSSFRLNELGVCSSLFFGELELFSLQRNVEMVFKGKGLGRNEFDFLSRYFLFSLDHEGSLTCL